VCDLETIDAPMLRLIHSTSSLSEDLVDLRLDQVFEVDAH
jgi:hypothetical protein